MLQIRFYRKRSSRNAQLDFDNSVKRGESVKFRHILTTHESGARKRIGRLILAHSDEGAMGMQKILQSSERLAESD